MGESLPSNRREFLKAGVATTAKAFGCSTPASRVTSSARPRFHTDLCDLLGVEYPILQSGMGSAAQDIVAAAAAREDPSTTLCGRARVLG